MVATRHALVLLFLCGCSFARHHRPEHHSEVSFETQTNVESGPVEPERKHRRKRWYSTYGYQQPSHQQQGYQYDPPPPPPAPAPYDPFAYIYRRLDELTAILRQPIQPPIVVPYPVYLPCSCTSGGPNIPGGVPETVPNITTPNRFGDGDDYDDIPIRPLDFNPVKPERPLSRPPPPVEHGSSQAGAAPAGAQQGRDPISAVFGGGFGGSASASAASAPTTNAPSRCDVATLTCCHQRYTTNQCFNTLRCPEALRRSDPCDARTIATVVSVFQNFYRYN